MKNSLVNCPLRLVKFIVVLFLLFTFHYQSSAQIPPPGYDYYKKQYEERMKISPLDRDSITLIDTVDVYNPSTYESERNIISSRLSLRDYCLRYLGMGNADILTDGLPHTIVDPKTYNDITIRLNQAGKIDTIK